jgi:hypothetical protein
MNNTQPVRTAYGDEGDRRDGGPPPTVHAAEEAASSRGRKRGGRRGGAWRRLGVLGFLGRECGLLGGGIQARVLPEDLLMQGLHLGRRPDAQLVIEGAPQAVVCGERVRLPSGTVQRQHPQGREVLAQGVPGREGVESLDRGWATERQLRLDPQLARRRMTFGQPRRHRSGEPVQRDDVRQRVAPPEPEGVTEQAAAAAGFSASSERPSATRCSNRTASIATDAVCSR